jgi:hypothetical protein
MQKRIFVQLRPPYTDRLIREAAAARRSIRDQAAILLEAALRQENIESKAVTNTTGEAPHAA